MAHHPTEAGGKGRINSTIRKFLDNSASSGIVLMGVAALAIITANSPFSEAYFSTLRAYIGPLSVQHWINDALMAVFFLMVGLEIKREMLDGQLSTWSRRILPGVAAAGGMIVPALIYVAVNHSNPEAWRGWAIPSATDIAFALGVLSLLGSRVPATLKVFLAALAIIDDLGAVIVIALFYTADLKLWAMGGAAAVIGLLIALNTLRVMKLYPYLLLGGVLWFFVLQSGIHATLAGVVLALLIPLVRTPATPEASPKISPLHKLEHALHKPVSFLIVPIFGFANAGVSFAGVTLASFTEPVALGVAAGLTLGKVIGIFGAVYIVIRLGFAALPVAASWRQMFGISLLCGIGFTMSLFIGLLAFVDPLMQDRVKLGILLGSLIAGSVGYLVLRFAPCKPLEKSPQQSV